MDLTNRRFGRLVVVRREYVPKVKWEKIKQPTWMCECDCGKITYAFDSNLRQGRTQSCGCLRKEVSKESSKRNFKHKPKEDLIGKRFGRLVVLRPSERTLTNRIPLWVTQCECGNVCEVRMDRLKSGKTKSCGCLRRGLGKSITQGKRKSGRKIEDLTGTRFGRLVVQSMANVVHYESGAKPKWECLCDCGYPTVVYGVSLKSGDTQSCGCLRRRADVPKRRDIATNPNIS